MKDDRLFLIFGIKLERVWGVVEHSLPGLKSAVRAMLHALGG